LHFKFSISVEHLRCLLIWGNATVLGAPLAKRLCAATQIPINVGHRSARFNQYDRIHDLAIGEF
jgi:hypothetical protein